MTHRQINPEKHILEPETETEQLMMLLGYPTHKDTELIEIIKDTVEALPERHRRIVEAIFYQQASYADLGEILGVSKPHAWRLSRRAFEELRQQLLNNEIVREKYGS